MKTLKRRVRLPHHGWSCCLHMSTRGLSSAHKYTQMSDLTYNSSNLVHVDAERGVLLDFPGQITQIETFATRPGGQVPQL